MLPARVWQLRREPWVPDGERHGSALVEADIPDFIVRSRSTPESEG